MFVHANAQTVRGQVVRFVPVWKLTVQHVWKEWCNPGGLEALPQICGSKKTLTKRDEKEVSRLIDENRFQTRQEFLQSVNKGPSQLISELTLRRKLCAISILSRARH